MWRWLIAGGAVIFLAGSAFAQSQDLSIGKSYVAVNGYDFGNRFTTGIEGLTSPPPPERFGLSPANPTVTSTSVMLKGLYEVSDGAWRMKPYLGAGFGVLDLNAGILGASNRLAAYQLRGGVTLGFTQKLIGSLEYRWTNGSKPNFSLAGIPTKFEVDRHRFVVGVNFKY